MPHVRKNERAKERISIHFKRISASLELVAGTEASPADTATQPATEGASSAEKMDIRIILNDVTLSGAGIYTPRLLNKGQEVILTFQNPFNCSLRGRVIWSQEFNVNSHVISNQAYPYRAGIEFSLQSDEDQTNVERLCEEISL